MVAQVYNFDPKLLPEGLAKLRCDGRGGRQRPDWGGNELKKTSARSARARTRGQKPLVEEDLYSLATKRSSEQQAYGYTIYDTANP
jgi:hypothetical protein